MIGVERVRIGCGVVERTDDGIIVRHFRMCKKCEYRKYSEKCERRRDGRDTIYAVTTEDLDELMVLLDRIDTAVRTDGE